MVTEEEDQDDDQLDIEQKIFLSCYVNSEKVINYAKNYFNCDDIDKIYLEKDEYNNFYWPSRKFLGEIMTKFDDYEEKVLSKFTLSFLEDLGYLIVKDNSYFTGGLMRFGKHKGCEFFNGLCGAEDREESTFSNEFYLPKEFTNYYEYSCSSGRLGKTIYTLHPGDSSLLDKYEYKLETETEVLTGLKQTNYCPFAEYKEPSHVQFATGFCYDSNTEKDDYIFEELGPNSFCVLSSLIKNTFKSVCYKMSCSSESLTINVGNHYIVCPKEGGLIQPIDFVGYLLCPDFNLICTGEEICNNLIDCVKKSSNEKDSSLTYDYEIIKTTQNPEIYKAENPEVSLGWELSDDGFCPKYCRQCGPEPDKNCKECAPGYKIYDENENKCHEIVPNCKKYKNNEICEICNEGFFLAEEENGTLVCYNLEEKGDEYFEKEGLDYRIKCNKNIQNCLTCNSEDICNGCIGDYQLIDDGLICDDKTST